MLKFSRLFELFRFWNPTWFDFFFKLWHSVVKTLCFEWEQTGNNWKISNFELFLIFFWKCCWFLIINFFSRPHCVLHIKIIQPFLSSVWRLLILVWESICNGFTKLTCCQIQFLFRIFLAQSLCCNFVVWAKKQDVQMNLSSF